MQSKRNLFAWGFKIQRSLIFFFCATTNLPAKSEGSRNVVSIQNPQHRMIMVTPQMLQEPELYKIQLAEKQELSRPVFSLYHRSGVKVFEKQLELSGPFDTIPFGAIFDKTVRLPAGYYFYDLWQRFSTPTANPTQDSLFFRDVSNTHLPMDSTFGGLTEFADVNGDLFPDIITGFVGTFRRPFSQPRLLINDGKGHFSDQTSQRFPHVEISVNDLAVLDVDLDGDLDIFSASIEPELECYSTDKLFLNNGNDFFSDVAGTHLPHDLRPSFSVDNGLINDDLFPDLLISSTLSVGAGISCEFQTVLYILINDGNGNFTNQSSKYLPENAYGIMDAILTDVNADALIDIVMANSGFTETDEEGNILLELSGQDAVLIQKNNQFVDETQSRVPPEDDDSKLIKVADMNNDGMPELFIANFPFDPARTYALYLNDGQGRFQDVTADRLPQQNITWINDIELRDFDANGYVDMYIVNVIPGIPAEDFLNFNYNGFFTDVSQLLPPRVDFGFSCSSADMELDGDFDIFVSNGAGTVEVRGRDLLLENLQIKTAISQTPGAQPGYFDLAQNHPNPFNPTTEFQFSLPLPGHVTLKIYNILGEEVATVVNEKLSARTYEVEWDASDVVNGVYLYRLQAGEFVETRKLTVLR